MKTLRHLMSLLRPAAVSESPAAAPERLGPMQRELYELLFCDRVEAFAVRPGAQAAPWQAALFAAEPQADAIRSLADDAGTESRVRALANHWLRSHGHEVPKRVLLGVVFEVPMGPGLDVLAAYTDGSVRLLHHRAPPAIVEGEIEPLRPALRAVFDAAHPIVARIGPMSGKRLPPPEHTVRMSFIVSDGIYMGEGPMDAMERDGMAGPLLRAGAGLMSAMGQLAGHR